MEVCAANQIGEIWVCSDSSVSAYHAPTGAMLQSDQPQPFGACIAGYDNRVRYVRTGDLGFLWNGQQQQHLQSLTNQGQLPAASTQASHSGSGSFQLFVLGSMEDSFEVQGLLHFFVDVETTIEGSHANVAPQGWYVSSSTLAVDTQMIL
jgi:acyl-CoA synthetase (AMP-forming)/AMP-acid ligase II